jgi:hypothetical protein
LQLTCNQSNAGQAATAFTIRRINQARTAERVLIDAPKTFPATLSGRFIGDDPKNFLSSLNLWNILWPRCDSPDKRRKLSEGEV